jgi:hypothetical protein
MDVERETVIEAGVATAAVGAFVVALMVIGASLGNGLEGMGALAVIAAMVGFVFLMAGVGYWLSGMTD